MTRAQRIALVADYLRSKEDKAGWINDYIGIENLKRTQAQQDEEADFFLDTAEAMQFDQIGEWVVNKIVDHYLPQAEQWRIDHSDRAA